MPGLLKIWMMVHNNRTLSNRKTLEPGKYFRWMQAGAGTTNITHGRIIITVCYQTEKTCRRIDIFERGSLVEPNVLC